MRVNGYKLREALSLLELKRDAASAQFKESLHCFEGETKESPDSLMLAISDAEASIADLQTAQAEYNLKVQVSVQDRTMSLCRAIKLMGGATRVENYWKIAAGTRKERGAYPHEPTLVRSTDQITAKAVLQPKELLGRATIAATFAAALRSAVAQGNATDLEMDLNPSLLGKG